MPCEPFPDLYNPLDWTWDQHRSPQNVAQPQRRAGHIREICPLWCSLVHPAWLSILDDHSPSRQNSVRRRWVFRRWWWESGVLGLPQEPCLHPGHGAAAAFSMRSLGLGNRMSGLSHRFIYSFPIHHVQWTLRSAGAGWRPPPPCSGKPMHDSGLPQPQNRG